METGTWKIIEKFKLGLTFDSELSMKFGGFTVDDD